MKRPIWSAAFVLGLLGASAATADVAVNSDSLTSDSEASLSTSADGVTWAVWHAYRKGSDRIMARCLGPARKAPTAAIEVSALGACGPPVVVATSARSAWVFWSERRGDRWRLFGRQIMEETPQDEIHLSGPAEDAIYPAAAPLPLGDGRVVISWCAYREGTFRVLSRVLDAGVWQAAVEVSPPQSNAFRSAVTTFSDGRAWVVWDSYGDGRYGVWGRRIAPALGPAERISPPGQNCLTPVALAATPTSGNATPGAGQPLIVAWLHVTDVIGGEGAITQWYTLEAAMRAKDGWHPMVDRQGRSAAATLTHGLIARMEPEPVATGGYMGRRRQPMLIDDGPAVWLLWERKTDHRGASPTVGGDLVGRRWQDGCWQEPVILAQGRVDYRVAADCRTRQGSFPAVASELPSHEQRVYHLLTISPSRDATPFSQDDWPGWRPVALPLEKAPARHEIHHGGKTYRLWWADLHCHSGLTPDAEGEPDELLHYARDRARLDVVAITENDFIYDCFLTEGQFALNHFLAGCFTRPGRFLVLPGYEWTSRLPRSADVDRSDPRNWDSHFGRLSYPNHRSVIYPPSGGPVVRHPEVGNDIRRLDEAVRAAGGVTLTQHPTWDLTGSPREVGVEVTTGWGNYINDPTRLHDALNAGHRVGLVANGDSHRRNPGLCGGLTAVYAESLTAESILDALVARRVYATSGSHIVLDSRANDSLMGSETRSPDGTVTLTLRAVGTRPIVSATLVGDGRDLKTFEGDGNKELSVEWQSERLSPGTHWYYWRVVQEGNAPRYPGNVKVARGPLAWSSPHWVVVP